jgi:bacillithiol biosynthesis cysteine-adding enzyme BshC
MRLLDYDGFAHPPAPLFRAYLRGDPAASAFYGGGFDLDALVAAAGRAAAFPGRDRQALAAALRSQQEARGAAAAAAIADTFAHPRAVAIVTGQQPGLFGGPRFVLYKALGAMVLAEALAARWDGPVVPVFWVASDDHDFAEVRQASFLDDGGRLRTLRYEPHHEPTGQPASAIVLDDTIATLVGTLREALPASTERDEMVGRIERAYRPGATLAGAFAQLLSDLLPGLVVLDPSDAPLKRLMAPVMEREVADHSPSTRLAAAAGERLLAAGFHQQVPIRDGFLNLFVVSGGERRALALHDGTVEVRGTDVRMPAADAARAIATDPTPWSPGVLLRPLAEDLMLPTAAYVGGPAEVAYHAQIGPAYAHFGIPRPVVMPRPSLTLVEPAHARALEAEGIGLLDLEGDPESLLGRWARQDHPEVEAAFADARSAIQREMGRVGDAIAAVDPTLRGAADSALGRALHQVEGLQEKSLRALKKRDQSRADRLRRTRDALLPGGALQERGLGLVGLLARHGTAIIDVVRKRMDPWARGHQVVEL